MSSIRWPGRGSTSACATSRRSPRRRRAHAARPRSRRRDDARRPTSARAASTSSPSSLGMDALNRLFANDARAAALRARFRPARRRPAGPLKRLLAAEAAGDGAERAEAAARAAAMSDAHGWSARTRAAQALGRSTRRRAPSCRRCTSRTTFVRDPAYADWSGFDLRPARQPDRARSRGGDRLARRRASTLLFGSGMSAAIALFLAWARARASSRRGACTGRCAIGWRTRRRTWPRRRVRRPEDLGALSAAVAEKPTRLVWLETPSNPLWSVTDIAAAAEIAHAAGAALAVELDLRDAGLHPAARARRRRRHAFGDQVSQRPFRRDRRRARLRRADGLARARPTSASCTASFSGRSRRSC